MRSAFSDISGRHYCDGRKRRGAAIAAFIVVLGLPAFAWLQTLALRASSTRRPGDAGSLLVQTLIESRQLYALLRRSQTATAADLSARKRQTISNLERLASIWPDPQPLRRLALMQHTFGDSAWKSTISRMRDLPRSSDPYESEREMALWSETLEPGRLRLTDVPFLRAQIASMDLGWYEHVALEALYRNAGLRTDAEAQSREALRAAGSLLAFWQAGESVARSGLGLTALFAAFLLWRRRNPLARVPHWLRFARQPALPRRTSDALYGVFVGYLAAYSLLKFAANRFGRPVLEARGASSSDPAFAMLSLGVVALSAGVALLLILIARKRTGVSFSDLGFRSQGVAADVAWGIAGYVMAVPFVWAATALSSVLFQPRAHPAINMFVATESGLAQAILALQAIAAAPIVEETFFRGVFFRSLTARMSVTASILIASFVFAVLHPQLPVGFLGLFILGAVFNLLYALRGSLLPAIVAHSLNNAAIFALAYLVGR